MVSNIPTILIVSDNKEDQNAIEHALSQENARRYVLWDEISGAGAIEYLRHATPDCIFLGDTLLDMTGLEFFALLHSESTNRHLPCAVVFVTNMTEKEIIAHASENGLCSYLPRHTLTPELLTSAIEDAILKATPEHHSRKLEDKTRVSEERYHVLAETMLQGIVHQDAKGNIIAMNPAAQQILGKTREEFIGSSSDREEKHTIKENGTRFLNKNHPSIVAIKTGKPVRGVVMGVFNSPLNAYRWIRIDAMPLFHTGERRPFEVYTIFEDITEQRQIEAEMRVSEIRYRRLFEAAKDGVLLLDPETRKITDANPFMKSLLGYTHDELIGKELFEIGLLKDEVASQAMFETLKIDQQVRYENLPLESQTGEKQEVEVVANLYREDNKMVIQCNIRDITERKKSEAALHASEVRMHLATEATGVGIWLWNIITNRLQWDIQMFHIYGITPTADAMVLYSVWSEAVLQEELPERILQDTVRGLGNIHREFRILRHSDQEIRDIQSVETVHTNAKGEVEWVVGTNLDITERKMAQQKIEDLNIQLQNLNTQLRRAVAESHHRIKNNLQVLSTLVELQTPEDVVSVPISQLKRITQHISALAGLHDLLTLELKEAPNREAISLKATLEKLTPMLQATTGTRKIVLRVEEMMVSIKQGSSFTMLINELVSNALKHGNGVIGVSLTAASPTAAQLTVTDDGPGFPLGFDPIKDRHIGLELIESMAVWDLRGEITYENRAEGGACVRIVFPLLTYDLVPPLE